MRIDRRELGKHYASLNDEELLSLKRDDLTETAQIIYDLEIVGRGLKEKLSTKKEIDETLATFRDIDSQIENESPGLSMLQDGVCACSFTETPGSNAADKASQAQVVLKAAGIPSCLRVTRELEDNDKPSNYDILNVIVPVALFMHAASILDRDFLNEEFEAEWRDQLNMLSDKDLLVLDPAVFCAGLLDRVARIKKAYAEEMARRKLKTRTI